jgi:hypothetical protein
MRFPPWLSAAVLLVFFVAAFALRAPLTAQAEIVGQDASPLEGINIYFTESAVESSRFDRSDAGLSRFAGLLRQFGANLYTLEWRTGFPTDADLIVIAGPMNDFAPEQIARLWSYVNNNGRLLLLANPLPETTRAALPATSGLFQLMWADMGIRALNDYLLTEPPPVEVTPESPEATPQAAPISFPIVRFLTGDISADHPITDSLGGELAFFGARSIEVDAALQGFIVTPLVFSPQEFYGETNYTEFARSGVLQYNIGTDTSRGPLPVAASFENPATGTRIVLIGDSDFARNGAGLQTSPRYSAGFIYPANARFLVNAATWLVERETVALTLPTPGPTASPTITASPTLSPTPTGTLTPMPEITPEATQAVEMTPDVEATPETTPGT